MEYTFDQVADMLDEMAEAFPPVFLKNSMAVSCSRKRPNWTPCSLKGRFTSWGEYVQDGYLGRYINLYYGSFLASARNEDWDEGDLEGRTLYDAGP